MPHILSLILMHTICTSFLLPSLQHTIFIQRITSLFQSWIIWAFLYSAIISSLSCSKEPKHSVCKPEIPSAPAQDSSPAQTEKSRGDMSSYSSLLYGLYVAEFYSCEEGKIFCTSTGIEWGSWLFPTIPSSINGS